MIDTWTPTMDIDTLTGTFARSGFGTSLARSVQLAQAAQQPFALCVIDVDYFKSINDAFGHRQGDKILSDVTMRMRSALRIGDLLFRYGGDEFVLLLPQSTREEATTIAGRILSAVADTPLGGNPPMTVTLSIGVAALAQDATSPDTLFERADARLLEAKRRGRSCVVAADYTTAPAPFDADMRLLERDMAVQTIHETYHLLTQQRRAVLLVTGEAGTGRTRLLSEVARAADLRGYTAISVVGHPTQRTRMFGALGDALARWGNLRLDGQTAQAVADGLVKQIRLTGGLGLIVCFDDVTDLDAGTIEVARALLASTADVPILIAGVGDEAVLTRYYLSAPIVRTLAAAPLSREATLVWLRGLLSGDPPEAVMAWLYERTGGRPHPMARLLDRLLQEHVLTYHEQQWVLRGALETIVVPPTPPFPHTLPAVDGVFVGRLAEVQQVKSLLDSPGLVSLVGSGGVGKTRLAVQVALEVYRAYRDGAIWVDLATCSSPQDAFHAVARTLDLPITHNETVAASVSSALQQRQLLLVLDNAETLAEAASFLHDVLATALQTTVLITAREAMHLPQERVLRLAGLSGSGNGDAAVLLVQRVRDIAPHHPADDDMADAIPNICRAVDGMPLALEMAAAWVPVLGYAGVAEVLRTRVAELDGGHATKEGAVQSTLTYLWSTLGPSEQSVLAGLSIFSSSFTGEAARAVAGASPFLIAALVDRAILQRAGDGHYRLHEMVRQSGQQRLSHRPRQRARFQQRHAAYYLARVEQAQSHFAGAQQGEWMQKVAQMHANVLVAFRWLTAARNGEGALRMANGLALYWDRRSHFAEGRACLEEALSCSTSTTPPLSRAQAYQHLSLLALRQSDYATATASATAALHIFSATGQNRADEAGVLSLLGRLALEQGAMQEAYDLFSTGLAYLRADTPSPMDLARCLGNMGVVADEMQHYDEALAMYDEGLTIARTHQIDHLVGMILCNSGRVLVKIGQPERAIPRLEEGVLTFRTLKYPHSVAFSTQLLAMALVAAARAQGTTTRLHEAIDLLRESCDTRQTLGDQAGVLGCLYDLADARSYQGHLVAAAHLYGAALAIQSQTGISRIYSGQDHHQRLDKALTAHFEAETLARLHAEGAAMTLPALMLDMG